MSRFGEKKFEARYRKSDDFAGKHSSILKMLSIATKSKLSITFGTQVGSNKHGEELRPYAQQLAQKAFAEGFRKEAAGTAKRLEDKIKEHLRQGGLYAR